jgi:hypothetical protein
MRQDDFSKIYRLAAKKIGRPRRGGNFTVFDGQYTDGSSIHLYMSHNMISISIRARENDEQNRNLICTGISECGSEKVTQILAIIEGR